jgi:hypothetical protein
MNTENNQETTTDTAVNADVGQEVPCWKIDVKDGDVDGGIWQLWWKGESRHRVAAGLLKTMNTYKMHGTYNGVDVSGAECLLRGVDACIHFILHSKKWMTSEVKGLAVALKRSADVWIKGDQRNEDTIALMKQVDSGQFLVMKKEVRNVTEAAETIDWVADMEKRMNPKGMLLYVKLSSEEIFPLAEFHRLRGMLVLPRERSIISVYLNQKGKTPMRANIYLMLMGV